MPRYRGQPLRIFWGAAFANTLNVGYPLDSAITYSLSREGSEWAQGASGVEDAWITGTDHYLEGDARWIPQTSGTTPEGKAQTGWDGATGWCAMLEWARAKNVIRVELAAGDATSRRDFYLVEPMEEAPELEKDMTRRVHLRLRAADGQRVEGY